MKSGFETRSAKLDELPIYRSGCLMSYRVTVLTLLCLFIGCNSRPGARVYSTDLANESDAAIWVEHITGINYIFDGVPLDPGSADIGFVAGETHPLPASVTIRWWKGDRKRQDTEPVNSEIVFGEMLSDGKRHTLKLTFTKEDKWTWKLEE